MDLPGILPIQLSFLMIAGYSVNLYLTLFSNTPIFLTLNILELKLSLHSNIFYKMIFYFVYPSCVNILK